MAKKIPLYSFCAAMFEAQLAMGRKKSFNLISLGLIRKSIQHDATPLIVPQHRRPKPAMKEAHEAPVRVGHVLDVGFDPGSCTVFWTLDDHVCSVVSVLHQGVAVLNYTVDKVSVTCEITEDSDH